MMTTTTPDRPPYDGNRSEGFALTDAPVYMEHGTGEDEGCGPVLGLDLVVHPDPALVMDLTTGDDWNEPDLRDGVLDVIERTLHDRYSAKVQQPYSVEVRLSGDGYMWDRVNKRVEVYVTVEFYGGLYRGDESADDWCGRIVSNCPYWTVVNELHTFDTGQRAVEAALRQHHGLPAVCSWCDGSGTMHTSDDPCSRCDGSGVDSD